MQLSFDIDLTQRRRAYTPGERVADGCVHVLGLGAGVIGAAIIVKLAAAQHNPRKLVAIFVYAAGLLAMLAASAAYNIADATRFRALLRRCDHSAIFLMIAGTYTPLTMSWTSGLAGTAATVGIWLTSVSGITLKWLAPRLFERLAVLLFLALGWASLLLMWPLGTSLPPVSLAALIAGGALYTIGVVFHRWESLPFQNAIWHGFVLVAAVCHYLSILEGVVLPKGLG
jgi:hemolysin III